MWVLTSWDDGHPLDERLADLLDRYGLKATFFVPFKNSEGRPVMSTDALCRLDGRFEIGSHTMDHVVLTELSREECERQVVGGKDALEQLLGHVVSGFCYPRGKYNVLIRDIVMRAGCNYARTIENLRLDLGEDPFSIPTSIQLFPHGKQVLIRNYLRYGHYITRFEVLKIAMRSKNWFDFIVNLLKYDSEDCIILHIWGHSWEIEGLGLWNQIEELFSIIAAKQPKLCTISELIKKRARQI